MIHRQNTLVWMIIGLVVLLTSALGVESGGKRHTYEVRNTISTPQYRSDAARAIDAYERLMERYMSLTEANLVTAQADNRDMAQRLTRVESSLERIEYKLDLLSRALQINPAPSSIPTGAPPSNAPIPSPAPQNTVN